MLTLIIDVVIVLSFLKPEVWLSQKIRSNVSQEDQDFLARNYCKAYGILLLAINTLFGITDGYPVCGFVSAGLLIAFFIIGIPALKANNERLIEIGLKEAKEKKSKKKEK